VALCHDDYDCGAALTTGVSSLALRIHRDLELCVL
jgi:hypothetical protein